MTEPDIFNTHILHADDDDDDRYLFKKVLGELEMATSLISVGNGHELMQLLQDENYRLPDVLFLDLNMPLKNGFECLAEIKKIQKLAQMPIVIFSTAYPNHVVDKLYALGARYFIRKPDNFKDVKDKISLVLGLIKDFKTIQPSLKEFVI